MPPNPDPPTILTLSTSKAFMIAGRSSFNKSVRSLSLPATISRFLPSLLIFCSLLIRRENFSAPISSCNFFNGAANSGLSWGRRTSKGTKVSVLILPLLTNSAFSSDMPKSCVNSTIVTPPSDISKVNSSKYK